MERSHRDIKPANLMLSGWREGKVNLTLVDWASSRLHTQGDLLPSACCLTACLICKYGHNMIYTGAVLNGSHLHGTHMCFTQAYDGI